MKTSCLTSCLFIIISFISFSCKTTDQIDCIDPDKINPEAMCTAQYDPVCGCDGRTYGNSCEAENAGVISFERGACPE